MRSAPLLLALTLWALPVVAQDTAPNGSADASGGSAVDPDDRPAVPRGLAQRAAADGPFGDIGAFYDWIDANQPMSGGELAVPSDVGSAPNPAYFVLDRDSTVYVQAADGDGVVLDTYIPYLLGQIVDQEIKYSAAPAAGSGWGFEEGRLYLYLTSGLPLWSAIGLAILVPLGVGFVVVRLWRGLRLASERGEQLADSRRRLADSREAERMHLARDLHDGPLQDLQAVRMQLGLLRRTAPDTGADAIDAVQDNLLRVVRELRGVSEGLRPPVLGPFGLAAALRALVGRLRESHPAVAVDLDLANDGTDLTEAARLTLYRIAQEALNNALAHGQPSRLHLAYREAPDGVHLSIQDDGVGCTLPDVHTLEAGGHLGVAGMTERAESVGGVLAIESQPGHGTRVSMVAPRTVLAPSLPAASTQPTPA